MLINTKTRETTFTMGSVPKHLHARLRARKTQINLCELLAIWAAAITLIKQISQASTVIFTDNQSALNMVIKGWSPCEDANMILHELWLLLARKGVSTHFEHVQSKSNLADGSSRGCTDFLHLAWIKLRMLLSRVASRPDSPAKKSRVLPGKKRQRVVPFGRRLLMAHVPKGGRRAGERERVREDIVCEMCVSGSRLETQVKRQGAHASMPDLFSFPPLFHFHRQRRADVRRRADRHHSD